MNFDFTSVIDRHGMDATAVEAIGDHKIWGNEPDGPEKGFDFIPMWVADMNFATCPSVTKEIIRRAEHPLFGYYHEPKEWYDRIIQWQSKRHQYKDLRAEYIGYENGVHGLVTSAMNILSRPGDKVLIHRPTYVGFAMDIDYQGRIPVYSDLVKDENGIYRMNFEDMDKKLKENNIHVAVFCSPHNPAGRVWERWELEKAMEVFEKNECYVISDEIWSDIVFDRHQHIPTVMVNDWSREHVVSAYALSKTFNLAGMCGSYHIIYSKYLRDRINAYSFHTSYNEQNVLTMHAFLGAYTEEGERWTNELNQVLEKNCRTMTDYLNSVNGVSVTMPEGTYMLFVDLTDYCRRTGVTQHEILKKGWSVGVGWQDGVPFGGMHHIRINVALPYSRVTEAIDRLKQYVFVK